MHNGCLFHLGLLANPQEGEDIAALGDRWNELSDSLQGLMRKSALYRAEAHYRLARSRLQGLIQSRVDLKLKALRQKQLAPE